MRMVTKYLTRRTWESLHLAIVKFTIHWPRVYLRSFTFKQVPADALILIYARYLHAYCDFLANNGDFTQSTRSPVRICKIKCSFARIKGGEFKTVATSVIQNELQRLQVFGSCLFRSTSGNQRGLFTWFLQSDVWELTDIIGYTSYIQRQFDQPVKWLPYQCLRLQRHLYQKKITFIFFEFFIAHLQMLL